MIQGNVLLLKNEVEQMFGRRILSSGDCLHLCTEISMGVGVKISFNTLRRLFNLMKTSNQPSIYTLNALANYCGYISFDNFISDKQRKLILCPEKQDHKLLSFLITTFKQIEITKKDDRTYLSLVKQVIIFIEHCPQLIESFQREVAKTANGQTYYFEKFVYIDKLNSYYGVGLQCYLNNKNTVEAQVFGHYMLCLKSWLTMNSPGVEMHSKKVTDYHIDQTLPATLVARYYATKLINATTFTAEISDIIFIAKRFFLTAIARSNCNDCIAFGMIFSEALLLTSSFTESLFYLDELVMHISALDATDDGNMLQTINLFRVIALAKTEMKTEANCLLQEVNPYKFNFLSRKYNNILYFIARKLLKDHDDDQQQIEFFARETGFVRLLYLVN